MLLFLNHKFIHKNDNALSLFYKKKKILTHLPEHDKILQILVKSFLTEHKIKFKFPILCYLRSLLLNNYSTSFDILYCFKFIHHLPLVLLQIRPYFLIQISFHRSFLQRRTIILYR